MQGTIQRIREERGFGFIRPEGDRDSGGDHFFHMRDLRGLEFTSAIVGTVVEFDSLVGPKGLLAKNVSPIQ